MAPSESKIPPPFELAGGALCLDFINTWDDWERPRTDKLHRYQDLLRFACQAEALSEEEADSLLHLVAAEPAGAKEAYGAARDLREACYRLFSARAAEEALPPEALALLNTYVAEAMGQLKVQQEPVGNPCCWAWCGIDESLTGPLWPLARSAAELLASEKLTRLRECGADNCTWIFLDESRNRSRRWCSMETCGNRAKARRHYRKTCREKG